MTLIQVGTESGQVRQRQGKAVEYTADKKALKELQAANGKLRPK